MTPTETGLLARVGELVGSLGTEAWALIADAGNRTHWVFLVSAVVLAVALGFGRRGARPSVAGIVAAIRRLGSRTARVDYGLVIIRPVVSALFITPWLATALAVAAATARGLEASLGAAPELGVPAWLVAVMFSVALFVTWDLSRFVLHWAMHRVDLLWEFHQVHHSAETLNPMTLYRVHPVERALYQLRGVAVTGVLTGVFFYAFGGAAVQVELLGVNALGVLFNFVGGNLRHSHVRWGWGRLERWFISPAQHQIHHQRADAPGAVGTHVNYGTWLAVWDRLAGSLARSNEVEAGPFGLAERDLNHRPDGLLSALFDPMTAAAARGWGSIRRRAKVLVAPWVERRSA